MTASTPNNNHYPYITDPAGIVTLFTDYDLNGNNTGLQVKDSDGTVRKTVAMIYDARNRLTSSTVTTTGQPAIVTTYDYDANDNLNYLKDAEQHETRLEYNYNRKPTRTTQYLQDGQTLRPVITNFEYGATGCPSCGGGADKLTAVVDAKQQRTSYQYDQLGRQEYETDPLGKKYHYTHYDNGLVKEKYDATTTPEKLLITYSYNNYKQLTKKQYSDGTPDEGYTYDSNDRMETAYNGNISYTFAYYDSGIYSGRLKSITDNSGRQISYDEYDNLGQRKKVTVLNGASDAHAITYLYDAANRPWKITSNAGTFEYLYDELGRRKTLTYPNGITATYVYDELDRLTSLTHANGANTIAFANYTEFDKTGNRKAKTTNSTSENYVYDLFYRLYSVNNPLKPESFLYDDVGNRTLGPGVKDTGYLYTGNQMTQGRKLAYGYDNAGNQTTKTVPGATDKSWVQTWNYENQLVKMEKTKGAEKRTVTFTYDSFGRRIGKQLVTVIDGVTKTSTWTYVYDGQDIAMEIYTDPTSTTTKTFYTHGAGTDEHLALERNGSYFYYHADGLGSVTSITDSSAAVVQSYTYDSFGMPKPTTNFRNTYQFTGRPWDMETGLLHMDYRYYDPMEGRFVSRDPIGFAGGEVNLYGYVQNSPVNYVDPLGLAGVARIGYRPLKLFRHIPVQYLVNDFDIKNNVALVHAQIWFADDTNVGFFDKSGLFNKPGMVRDDNGYKRSDYMLSEPVYDADVMKMAIRNVKSQWDGANYHFTNRNCQDFIGNVKNEYFRLGGKITQ